MKSVSIRFLTHDPYGNSHTLDVRNDEFGVLKYSFYGTNSRVPFSLSNMQVRKRFPDTIDSYKNVKKLASDIKDVVNSGTESVHELVFAKAL